MQTSTSLLRTGAYLRGWEIFNILSKPQVQIVLDYIERNPGCSSWDIFEHSGLPTVRNRISQIVKELKSIGVIKVTTYHPVNKQGRTYTTNQIKMDADRVKF